MAEQKKNEDKSASLLDGIQSEVSTENAPLLNFITKNASYIAGGVLTLLLILGGIAVWNWYHGGKQAEARQELARINSQLKGADRDKALAKLAENAPESTRLFIYMSLGQSAQENGDPVLAADAYAKAASLDGDGALGLTAALGSVGSLLMQAEYLQALTLLEELDRKLPDASKSMEFKQMLAEAAFRSGKIELAYKTYENLAATVKTPESRYFKSRAEALKIELDKKQNSSGSAETPK